MNDMQPETEWSNLEFQHQFSLRQNRFCVAKTNKLKVGENIMVSRLSAINHQIPLDRLNLTYTTYKIRYKDKYLR